MERFELVGSRVGGYRQCSECSQSLRLGYLRDGYFTNDGGNTFGRAAKWNGSGWTPLGSGPNGPADGIPNFRDIAVSGTNVYVSGYWHTANHQFLGGFVSKWNGSSWSEPASGMDQVVETLAVKGSDLYAGGGFTLIGGTPANRIAKWNGSSWSVVGSGMNSTVGALAVSGTDVYAGGWFTTAGGTPVNHVAKWNGSGWSAVGGMPIDPLPGGLLQLLRPIGTTGLTIWRYRALIFTRRAAGGMTTGKEPDLLQNGAAPVGWSCRGCGAVRSMLSPLQAPKFSPEVRHRHRRRIIII